MEVATNRIRLVWQIPLSSDFLIFLVAGPVPKNAKIARLLSSCVIPGKKCTSYLQFNLFYFLFGIAIRKSDIKKPIFVHAGICFYVVKESYEKGEKQNKCWKVIPLFISIIG